VGLFGGGVSAFVRGAKFTSISPPRDATFAFRRSFAAIRLERGLPSGRLCVTQKKPRLGAGAFYRGIMTPLHYCDAGADGPSGVDMLGCKGPAAGRFGRGEAATCALLFAAAMRAF
jgi:hypothetical protein